MDGRQSPFSSPHPPNEAPPSHLTAKLAGHDKAYLGVASPLQSGSGSPPFSPPGHGSSSSKARIVLILPSQHLFSPESTTPSLSKTQSPDPLDTFSKLRESPITSPETADIQDVSPNPVAAGPISVGSDKLLPEPQEHPQPTASSTSPSSDSEGHVGPTRASIRAWAKATPTGPPRSTPSPPSSTQPQSESDDSSERPSLTRSASRPRTVPSGSFSAPSSGDENVGPPRTKSVLEEGSSGNVADGESSGSEHVSSPPALTMPPSPPNESAPTPDRETLAPHPHPHSHGAHAYVHHPPNRSPPHAHVHPHPNSPARHPSRPPLASKSSSESSHSDVFPGHSHEQPDRLERRPHRHHYNARRRHRERDCEREHARRARASSHPTPPSPTAFTPFFPLAPLPPPSHSPSPLRPLQASAGQNNMDVLQEIARMLVATRRPLLRTAEGAGAGAEGDGWIALGPPRGNDVLDSICRMIVMEREG
ncbi:hypothetical protein C8Q78DRAFT_1082884 [Trametes maxima]|nr:hypothetical protein C8Q78DRAFT_1082884 [Trametes maxima]